MKNLTMDKTNLNNGADFSYLNLSEKLEFPTWKFAGTELDSAKAIDYFANNSKSDGAINNGKTKSQVSLISETTSDGKAQYIIKKNATRLDDELEYKIAKAYEVEGLPVAKYSLEEGFLKIEYLGKGIIENGLKDIIREELFSEKDFLEKSESMCDRVLQKGYKIAQIISLFNSKTNEILLRESSKDLKLELENRRCGRLVERYNVSENDAREHATLIEIMGAFPKINDDVKFDLFEIAKISESAFQKYKTWDADISPADAYDYENGFKISDLNRIKEISMQQADACLIDAFIPYSVPGRKDFLHTNPFDEDMKQKIIDKRLDAFEKSNQKIDREDYKEHLNAVRFLNAYSLIIKTMESLSTDDDFESVYRHTHELKHNLTNATWAIGDLGRQIHGDCYHYKSLIKNIHNLVYENLPIACPFPIINASLYSIMGKKSQELTDFAQEMEMHSKLNLETLSENYTAKRA